MGGGLSAVSAGGGLGGTVAGCFFPGMPSMTNHAVRVAPTTIETMKHLTRAFCERAHARSDVGEAAAEKAAGSALGREASASRVSPAGPRSSEEVSPERKFCARAIVKEPTAGMSTANLRRTAANSATDE